MLTMAWALRCVAWTLGTR